MPRRLHGNDIYERYLFVGKGALNLASQLRRNWALRQISTQLVRAATSAGANYQEARYAESRADFIHKLSVAVKESAELLYWLELVARHGVTTEDLPFMIRETEELIAILVASGRTARNNEAST